MAGSYLHCVDKDGKLYAPKTLTGMLECSSRDVYEAVEELYGMVWYLANELHDLDDEVSSSEWHEDASHSTAENVEIARQNYREGLKLAPGLNAHTEEED